MKNLITVTRCIYSLIYKLILYSFYFIIGSFLFGIYIILLPFDLLLSLIVSLIKNERIDFFLTNWAYEKIVANKYNKEDITRKLRDYANQKWGDKETWEEISKSLFNISGLLQFLFGFSILVFFVFLIVSLSINYGNWINFLIAFVSVIFVFIGITISRQSFKTSILIKRENDILRLSEASKKLKKANKRDIDRINNRIIELQKTNIYFEDLPYLTKELNYTIKQAKENEEWSEEKRLEIFENYSKKIMMLY